MKTCRAGHVYERVGRGCPVCHRLDERARYYRAGGRPLPVTLAERWWRWVEPDPITGCWFWTGACLPNGYGAFRLERQTLGAHRVGYELFNGIIPPGLVLDHLCRVRSCVNPGHLEPVTDQVNIARGFEARARAR